MSERSNSINYTGAKIEIPCGSSMCLRDLGILENILSKYDGVVKRHVEDGIVINAPFESKSDYTSFLTELSLNLLRHSNLGISHYLDFSNILNPHFVGRRSLILESYNNYSGVGDIFYENVLEKFQEAGLRVIRTCIGFDFVNGFEEIYDGTYLLDKYSYLSGSIGEFPRDVDLSNVEFVKL